QDPSSAVLDVFRIERLRLFEPCCLCFEIAGHTVQDEASRVAAAVADVKKPFLIPETSVFVLVFPLPIKQQKFKAALLMLDDHRIGAARSLALPMKNVAVEKIFVLGPVRGLVAGDEQPDRMIRLGLEDTRVQGRVMNIEQVAQSLTGVDSAR